MNRVILWDFDGTLGYREGNWEEAIFELTDNNVQKTQASLDLVSGMLQHGFPWQEPEKSFVGINNCIDWWDYIKPGFINIFKALGYDNHESILKASQMPTQYGKLEKWKLYEDTIPNLNQLNIHNWQSVLVTNNIPEFPSILKHLNIETCFETVFVSALTGFNKPNPLILNGFLETLPDNAKIVVVGDRIESDLFFARAIHAEGILVRSSEKIQTLRFDNLTELTRYLLSPNYQ